MKHLFSLPILFFVQIAFAQLADISFTKNWSSSADVSNSSTELTLTGNENKYVRSFLDVNIPNPSNEQLDVYFIAEIYLEDIQGGSLSYQAPKMKIYQGGSSVSISAFNLVETPNKKWFTTGMKLTRFDKMNLSQLRLEFGMQNTTGKMIVKNPQLVKTPPVVNFSFPFDIPQNPSCSLSINTQESHAFENDLLSMNSHFSWASLKWGSPEMQNLIKDKFPMTNMRFPGGTVGNFYEWKSDGFYDDEWGKLNSSAVRGVANGFEFDYPGYKKALFDNQAGATLMFNVISDSVAKAKERLQSRLNDGLTIDWIEMGNENFFDKQNYGNVSSLQNYIAHTKKLSKGLKEVDPTIQTAINVEHSTYDTGGWNMTLAQEDYYDAVVTHPYINTNTFLLNDFSARQMFSSYKITSNVIHEYKTHFGTSKPLLLTEWSILSEGTPVNFAQTLGLADMFLAIEQGNFEGIVKQAGIHMFYHSDNYNEATMTYMDNGKLVLTANGVWYSSLYQFFQNRKVYNAISTSPELEQDIQSIYAKAVQGTDSIHVYAINKLPVSAPLHLSLDGKDYQENYTIKSFSEDPNTQLTTPYQLDNLPWKMTKGTNTIQLPAYSISMISIPKKEVITTTLKQETQKLIVSPNPTKGKVNLSFATDWKLYTIQGELIQEGNQKEIDLGKYSQGMYLLHCENDIFKIIKE